MKTIADRAEALFDSWDNRTLTREEIANALKAVRAEAIEEAAQALDRERDAVMKAKSANVLHDAHRVASCARIVRAQ